MPLMNAVMGSWPTDVSLFTSVDPSEIIHRLYHQASGHFGIGGTGRDDIQLQLFASVALDLPTNAANEDLDSPVDTPMQKDSMFFAGGMVWRLDWCRAADPRAALMEHIAVAVHPKDHTENKIGVASSAPGMVQVWAVPAAGTPGKPVMVLGIVHNGLLAWDLKWCPDPAALRRHFISVTGVTLNTEQQQQTNIASLGTLAMVLGDGSVQVLDVPDPQKLPIAMTNTAAHLRQAFLKITPQAVISPHDLSGALPSTVDWQQVGPHAQLLVGCWDGSVSLWELPPAARGACRMLLKIRADPVSIRRVAWMPPCVRQSVDNCEKYMFLTVGNSGRMKIWDWRDVQAPVVEKMLARAWILDAVWSLEPLQVNAVLSDSSIRQLVMEPGVVATYTDMSTALIQGENKGCIWSLAHSPTTGLFAYAGEDGVVGLFPQQRIYDSRRQRKPHAAVGAFKVEAGVLRVLSWRDLQDNAGLYNGPRPIGLQKTQEDGFPDLVQTVYTVAFSPHGTKATWLAYGGHAGLVRCQRVAATIEA